jgi:hypothetical protein
MSPLVLSRDFACLVVICLSSWICLVERSLKHCSCHLLCAGEDLLPLTGDVDEGCHWEVQTSEGWTPYWDPQA